MHIQSLCYMVIENVNAAIVAWGNHLHFLWLLEWPSPRGYQCKHSCMRWKRVFGQDKSQLMPTPPRSSAAGSSGTDADGISKLVKKAQCYWRVEPWHPWGCELNWTSSWTPAVGLSADQTQLNPEIHCNQCLYLYFLYSDSGSLHHCLCNVALL